MLRGVVAAIAFLSYPALLAQDFRATITGQVTDKTRAAIPETIVKAIQPDTNQVTDTVTNAEGYYTLAQNVSKLRYLLA